MPNVKRSDYQKKPFWMINGHFETIIPSMFYDAPEVSYQRQRMELDDGDFVDLDWLNQDSDRLIIISHGLEGSSDRYYVRRTARFFQTLGWDVVSWNCRSCSGEMNRLPRFYHHGDTEDLSCVINEALSKEIYKKIVLIGYSMGGSMSLKYLGEKRTISEHIAGAVTFSVPVNLKSSALEIEKKQNRIYEKRFLKKLIEKIQIKSKMHPDVIDVNNIEAIKTFDEFHERYTVPLHGFNSIDDFYQKATCDQYLEYIDRPCLIVNAYNDPMLGDDCYPFSFAEKSSNIFLEVPKVGGHVGFTIPKSKWSYMEYRSRDFIQEKMLQ